MIEPPFLIALLAAVLKIAVVVGTIMLVVPMIVWLERKVMADMQSRVGPNRVGPWGLLQSFADGIKLLAKESILPVEVDQFLYFLAPVISMVPALAVAAVIPFGGDLQLGKYTYRMVIADLPVGFLFVLALTSLSVYGIVLSGWASNNKYSLLGGLRSSAQMVSYELPMGLSIIAGIMIASYASKANLFTLSLRNVVDLQKGGILHWGAFNYHFPLLGFLAMITFYIGGLAETNRAPFDLPEAESELIGGYHTEYGGMKWAMFFLGEYGAMLNVAAMTTTLFLGGWHGPGVGPIFNWGTIGYCLEGIFWYCLKVFVILYVYIWIRATLPRIRYDRLMGFAWKYLLPTTLLNVLLVAAILTIGYRLPVPQVLAQNEPELTPASSPSPGGLSRPGSQFPSAPLGRGRSGIGDTLNRSGASRGGARFGPPGGARLGSPGGARLGTPGGAPGLHVTPGGSPGLHVTPGGLSPAPRHREVSNMAMQQEAIYTERKTTTFAKVKALVDGLVTTAKEAMFGQTITQEYPEEHYLPFPRFRGRHVLRRHENGLEKCVGCALCAAVCPAHCIRVIGGENTDTHRISEGERYAEVYEIHMLRCIFCGMCVEACPTEALGMSGEYELASYSREAQLYDKTRLLEAIPLNDGTMTGN